MHRNIRCHVLPKVVGGLPTAMRLTSELLGLSSTGMWLPWHLSMAGIPIYQLRCPALWSLEYHFLMTTGMMTTSKQQVVAFDDMALPSLELINLV